MKLSIVIPCYNEGKNIPLILDKFAHVIKRSDIELILVNNGSTDQSKRILFEAKEKYSFLRIVDIEFNKGYGFGITSGLKASQGEYLAYTHADMQTDPSDVIKALDLVEQQDFADQCYIKGSRQGRNIWDQVFTFGMSCFESIYLKKILWDINAQPNLFHKAFFAQLTNFPKDFSLDLYLLYMAKKMNLNVIRFPVNFPPRIHGESSWNTGIMSKIKFIKRTINFSLNLKRIL